MPDFNVGEFFRQKRIQDQVNGQDPTYDPDSTTAWLEHATKFPTNPDVSSAISPPQDSNPIPSTDGGKIQFPQFTPEAAQAIGPTQPSQFKAPNIGPEEQAYREQLGQTPLRANDKPGMLRKIMGGVAGIGVGLHTSDPAAAGSATENVTHAPYYQQLQNFNQGLGIQQQKAQAEIGDVSRAATQQELEARRQAEEERAAAERARKDKFVYDVSQTAHDRKLEELRIQHGQNAVFHEAKLKDGSLAYLKRDPVSGKLINTDTNLPVEMNAVDTLSDPGKSLKQTQDDKIPAALQAGIKAREIVADPKQQGTPAYDAAQEYIKNLSAGKDPKTAFDAVKDKTNEERKAKGQPEMSSSELTGLAVKLGSIEKPPQMLIVDPSNNKFAVARPGAPAPTGFRTTTQQGQADTPTTQTRGKAEQASTVIHAGEDLKQYIDAHKNQLGKVGDYWQQMVSGTPIADPDIAEFQTRVASYAALQAAAHGFRGANVMKDFEGKIGGPAKNPEAIKRAIDGIASTMTEIQKTGGGGNSGVATHRYNPSTGQIEAK